MSDQLADLQAQFMRLILAESAPAPPGWGTSQSAGMDVYRRNYRSAVMQAISDTFERTARYVGESSFKRAATHHVIANPPGSWTIDDAGAGFDQTLAQLFPNNPEVAELAWLEWTMLQLATVPDSQPMNAQDFAEATAGFADEEWGNLRLTFGPRSAARVVSHNLTAMWRALDTEEGERHDPHLGCPQACLVWREGERPTFLLVPEEQAAAFNAAQSGESYGAICMMLAGRNPDSDAVRQAAGRAGAMLGLWLNEGLVAAINA